MLRIFLLLAASLLSAQIPDVAGSPRDFFRMRVIDVAEGTGSEAKPGQKFAVHYTGWLTDGKKFDSSRDRNEPLTFVQGRRHVIPGLDSALEGMKVGGKRRLYIPYQLAYGEKGQGPIPGKADLIFDVELVSAEDIPNLPAGQDLLLPFEDATMKIMMLAQAIPADKLDWRPTPGIRSVREVYLHLAYDNQLLLEMADKDPKPEEFMAKAKEYASKEKAPATKEEALEKMAKTFQAIAERLKTVRAGQLNQERPVFGRPNTNRGVYVVIDNHVSEHLGQLITYARMLGIKPPWSQGE